MFLGSNPAAAPFIILSKIFTILYFLYFLLVIPLLTITDDLALIGGEKITTNNIGRNTAYSVVTLTCDVSLNLIEIIIIIVVCAFILGFLKKLADFYENYAYYGVKATYNHNGVRIFNDVIQNINSEIFRFILNRIKNEIVIMADFLALILFLLLMVVSHLIMYWLLVDGDGLDIVLFTIIILLSIIPGILLRRFIQIIFTG